MLAVLDPVADRATLDVFEFLRTCLSAIVLLRPHLLLGH